MIPGPDFCPPVTVLCDGLLGAPLSGLLARAEIHSGSPQASARSGADDQLLPAAEAVDAPGALNGPTDVSAPDPTLILGLG